MTDYKKKYLRIQDLKLRFNEFENVNIYITSYFRSDKESNTFYPPSIEKGKDITFEMYNQTFIYVIPKNRNEDIKVSFGFDIYLVSVYLYGNNYNLITKLISGIGGLILILLVVIYLDGFSYLINVIKEKNAERKRLKEEEMLYANA